jgi:hypothetical protein
VAIILLLLFVQALADQYLPTLLADIVDTTLINLLMRFYEINDETIKIDDIEIQDLKSHDLYSMFGMVLQDTWLLTVR